MSLLYRWGVVYEGRVVYPRSCLPRASCGKIEFNIGIPYLQTRMIWQNDLNVPYFHFKASNIIIKGAELKIKVCSVIKKKKIKIEKWKIKKEKEITTFDPFR